MLPKANISSSCKTELTPAFIVAYILLMYSKKFPPFDLATLQKLVQLEGMLLKVISLRLHPFPFASRLLGKHWRSIGVSICICICSCICLGLWSQQLVPGFDGARGACICNCICILYLYLHLSCIVGARRWRPLGACMRQVAKRGTGRLCCHNTIPATHNL